MTTNNKTKTIKTQPTTTEQCRLIPIPAFVLDHQNKIIFCNTLLTELVSVDFFDHSITILLRYFKLLKIVDNAKVFLEKRVNQKKTFVLTYFLNEQQSTFEFTPIHIENTKNELIYYLHDITHLREELIQAKEATKQLEKEIAVLAKKTIEAETKTRQATDAKQSFLSNMSHEMNTPLNAILGFSQLLKAEDKNQKRYIAGIIDAGQMLSTLVGDILDITRFSSGRLKLKKTEVPLSSFLSELFSLWMIRCKDHDITFKYQMPKVSNCIVLLDAPRLRQVINNLLSNAVKFSRKGGIIEVFVYIAEVDNKACSLTFKVQDNGVGISEHILNQIFDIFSRGSNDLATQYSGAGLGLPLSAALVKLMGGNITVEANLAQGSLFTVHLPMIEVLEKQRLPIPRHSDKTAQNLSILVVEDEPLNRMVLVKMASKVVGQVYQATDGNEALLLLANRNVDLVIMDIDLPGMSGIEIAALMSRNVAYQYIPIVACTALLVNDISEKESTYFKSILPKPVKQKVMIETLKSVLKI